MESLPFQHSAYDLRRGRKIVRVYDVEDYSLLKMPVITRSDGPVRNAKVRNSAEIFSIASENYGIVSQGNGGNL